MIWCRSYERDKFSDIACHKYLQNTKSLISDGIATPTQDNARELHTYVLYIYQSSKNNYFMAAYMISQKKFQWNQVKSYRPN